jgi:hypothetical protein
MDLEFLLLQANLSAKNKWKLYRVKILKEIWFSIVLKCLRTSWNLKQKELFKNWSQPK